MTRPMVAGLVVGALVAFAVALLRPRPALQPGPDEQLVARAMVR